MGKGYGTTTWIPADIIDVVDKVGRARGDPRRSNTIRFLIILGLAEIGALDEEALRVHGIKKPQGGDTLQREEAEAR